MTHRFALALALLGISFSAACGSDGPSDDGFIAGITGVTSGSGINTTGTQPEGGATGTGTTGTGTGATTTGTGTTTTGTTTSTTGVDAGCSDSDSDGVCDDVDACEGSDDALDADSDTVPDGCDVCADGDDLVDTDSDTVPDDCDADDDDDGIEDDADNCPLVANFDQDDLDGDQIGDACDPDVDGDNVADDVDNCPVNYNEGQEDTDGDGNGDPCDLCEGTDDFNAPDADGDTVPDACDVCAEGDDLLDADGDETPDACDDDDDGDGVLDVDDNCPLDSNDDQADLDGDGTGDACDVDVDGDGVDVPGDNCPRVANGEAEADDPGVGNQTDVDGDGAGDACDDDIDGDGVANAGDNCPFVPNGADEAEQEGVGDQADFDEDGLGDACDDDDDDDGVPDADDRCFTDVDVDGDGKPGDDTADDDADGVPNDCDQCEGSDDDLDFDADDLPDGCDACGPGTELAAGAEYWLRLGEASNASAVFDTAAQGAVGVYGDAVELGAIGPSEDFDGAAEFPGGADAASHVALNSVARMPDEALTLTMWVQFEDLSTPQTLLSYAVGADGDVLVVGLADDAGEPQLSVTIAGATYTTPWAPTPRTWVHLAIGWDSASGALYVMENGATAAEDNLASGESLAGSGRLVLGQAQSAGQNVAVASDAPFAGLLDEVAIFDSVLDPGVVTDIAQAFGATNGCVELPQHCADVLGSGADMGDGVYRVYPAGTAVEVECDMTTDGGGWTKCGSIDSTACVEEGDDYVDADALSDASFCVVLFTDVAPDGMMVLNRSSEGAGERVVIDWSADPIAIGDYASETAVDCTFYDASGTADTARYSDCEYVSHDDEDFLIQEFFWQNAAWSFANGLGNGYSSNESQRVLLGPTFLTCSGDETWRNFAGRPNPTAGDMFLR